MSTAVQPKLARMGTAVKQKHVTSRAVPTANVHQATKMYCLRLFHSTISFFTLLVICRRGEVSWVNKRLAINIVHTYTPNAELKPNRNV